MSGDTLPFPGGDVPRPFGVPERGVQMTYHGANKDCPGVQLEGWSHCHGHTIPAALAGPESAAEHLRNALQLLEVPIVRLIEFQISQQPVMGEVAVYFQQNIDAVRRRVAAALAQLERP